MTKHLALMSSNFFWSTKKTYTPTPMNLNTSLCPKRDDGGLDHRYAESVRQGLLQAGSEAIEGLNTFMETTTEAEHKAAPHAVKVCLSILMTDSEQNGNNEFRLKTLRKSLGLGLQSTGFKPYRSTNVVKVAFFQKALIDSKSDAADWVATLPVDHQYALARMSDQGFNKAWAELSQWGTVAVTQKQLRELQTKYPQIENETRGRSLPASSKPQPFVVSDKVAAQVDQRSAASTAAVMEPYISTDYTHVFDDVVTPTPQQEPELKSAAIDIEALPVVMDVGQDVHLESELLDEIDNLAKLTRAWRSRYLTATPEERERCGLQVGNIIKMLEPLARYERAYN